MKGHKYLHSSGKFRARIVVWHGHLCAHESRFGCRAGSGSGHSHRHPLLCRSTTISRSADLYGTSPELQILDYTTVYARPLPLTTATWALQFTGTAIQTLYKVANKSLPSQGSSPDDLQREKELFAKMHSTSCALKVFSGITAAEGLETARRACGGHGYSLFSGIGSWYTEYLPNMTFDGDNFILSSQSTRYVCFPFLLSQKLEANPPCN